MIVEKVAWKERVDEAIFDEVRAPRWSSYAWFSSFTDSRRLSRPLALCCRPC